VSTHTTTAQALAAHLNTLTRDQLDEMWATGRIPGTTERVDFDATGTLAGDRLAEARHLVTWPSSGSPARAGFPPRRRSPGPTSSGT
jgi:hypothetical protein